MNIQTSSERYMSTKEFALVLAATALTVAVLFFAAIWGIESYFGEPSIHRDDAASEAK